MFKFKSIWWACNVCKWLNRVYIPHTDFIQNQKKPHSELPYQFVLRSLIIPDCGHFLLSLNTMLVCGLDIFTGSRAQPVLPHVLAHASEGSRFSSGQGCVFSLDSSPVSICQHTQDGLITHSARPSRDTTHWVLQALKTRTTALCTSVLALVRSVEKKAFISFAPHLIFSISHLIFFLSRCNEIGIQSVPLSRPPLVRSCAVHQTAEGRGYRLLSLARPASRNLQFNRGVETDSQSIFNKAPHHFLALMRSAELPFGSRGSSACRSRSKSVSPHYPSLRQTTNNTGSAWQTAVEFAHSIWRLVSLALIRSCV